MDDKTKPVRFSNASLRGLVSDSGYKLYIQNSAQRSLDSLPEHLKLQAENNPVVSKELNRTSGAGQ